MCLHVDGCEGSMSYRTADSTGKGESSVEIETFWCSGCLGDDIVEFRRNGSHCEERMGKGDESERGAKGDEVKDTKALVETVVGEEMAMEMKMKGKKSSLGQKDGLWWKRRDFLLKGGRPENFSQQKAKPISEHDPAGARPDAV